MISFRKRRIVSPIFLIPLGIATQIGKEVETTSGYIVEITIPAFPSPTGGLQRGISSKLNSSDPTAGIIVVTPGSPPITEDPVNRAWGREMSHWVFFPKFNRISLDKSPILETRFPFIAETISPGMIPAESAGEPGAILWISTFPWTVS